MPVPLAELSDLKNSLGTSSTIADDLLRFALDTSEELVQIWVGQKFEATPANTTVVKEIDVEANLGFSKRSQPRIATGPVISLTQVEVAEAVGEYRIIDENAWTLRPFGELPYRWLQLEDASFMPNVVTRFLTDWDGLDRTGRRVPERLRLTGRFGWPAVPIRIKRATVLLAARLAQRDGTPLGVKGEGVNVTYVRNNDPDLARMLDDLAHTFA